MHLNKTDVTDLDAFVETSKDCIIERQEKEIERLKAELQELRMQYISDFGQEQENEPVMTVRFARDHRDGSPEPFIIKFFG